MRLYMILIFTAVAMAFSTGYIALFLQGSYRATSSDVVDITALKVKFQKEVDPIYVVNFNALYFNTGQFQLLDPTNPLNNQDFLKSGDRYVTSQRCNEEFTRLLNQRNFEKVWIWEEFRCNRRSSLPNNFFIEGPYLHPSGPSFAYLAYKLGKNGYGDRPWVMNHLPFFHVSELSMLKKEFKKLSGIFNVLEGVEDDALVNIIRGKGTILTNNYLFARLTYPKIYNILEYRIYDRRDLDTFLKNTPYILQPFNSTKNCFYKDGSLCWDYNVKHIFKLANTSTLSLFFGFIVIIIIVVRLLLTKLKAQRLDDEKRRLALRVLTHEFRTPITSLTLLLEKMGNKYNAFDEEMEEVYLRLSQEVHRLRRLTETSRNYLKAEQNKKLLQLNEEDVSSINEFVEMVLEPFSEVHGDKIVFNKLSEDISVKIDTYWMGICMKNLIENATTHGDFPVEIELKKVKSQLVFSVKDQGKCQFESLGIMTGEFVKGNKSSGTGLGMNIVKKVCKEMGVGLELELNPTKFSLSIPIEQTQLRKAFNGQKVRSTV